jgi:PTS system nitrogen regulatory IIA component
MSLGSGKLRVRDAARLLGVSERTVHRWVESRKLPAHRAGGQLRFNRAELLEWATAEGVRVSVELFAAPDGRCARLPTLSDALAAGGILHDIPGDSRDEVLRAVVGRLQLPPDVDRDFLYQMLIARENLGSTAVGDGIAIPHVRNPVVLHAPSVITLCFLSHPIDFGALDGKPVDILFFLLSPTIRAHLHLLSRLTAALHDPRLREALARHAGADEIQAEVRRAEAALAR